MNPTFEHHYQFKVMQVQFPPGYVIATEKDVQTLRAQWMTELKHWHSPYKALIDCSHLKVNEDPKIASALQRLLKFLEGFFMRSAHGFGFDPSLGHEQLPIEFHNTEDEARAAAGLRTAKQKTGAHSFREAIQIQNHFKQHSVEITFSAPVSLSSKSDIQDFRSKLSNNLNQWHAKWNLIIDCSNLEFDPALKQDFDLMQRFFKGLHLKKVVGYAPRSPKENYPFETYRARHKAVAVLEGEGAVLGDEADCKSRR